MKLYVFQYEKTFFTFLDGVDFMQGLIFHRFEKKKKKIIILIYRLIS